MLGQADSLGIDCRNGSVALKPHAQHLCQAIHTVGRVHARARAAGRTYLIGKILHILLCHGSCRIGTHCLKHTGKALLLALHTSCQHRTSADKYRGNIQTGRCHQKPRHILVTVWNHHQPVKLMGQSHTFRRVGNQISCHQRILHPHMSHGNAVADRNGREHNRRSSCHCHTLLDCLYDLIQVHMSWNNLIIRADHPYQRPCQLLLRITQGPEQRSCRSLLYS